MVGLGSSEEGRPDCLEHGIISRACNQSNNTQQTSSIVLAYTHLGAHNERQIPQAPNVEQRQMSSRLLVALERAQPFRALHTHCALSLPFFRGAVWSLGHRYMS